MDHVIVWLLAVLAVGVVLSFLLELALQPQPVPPRRRPVTSIGVHVSIVMVVYGLELRANPFLMLGVFFQRFGVRC